MEYYDAAVVGGGPAGLTAAKNLAEKGLDVVLFERDTVFGRKPCGEAVSEGALRDAGLKPSPSFVRNEITAALVYPPDEANPILIERGSDFIGVGYLLDKPGFLNALGERAEEEGARIEMDQNVVEASRIGSYFKVKVKGGGEKGGKAVKCRFLMGCDGYASTVRRVFFDSSRVEMISCLQYVMTGCENMDEHTMEFYVGKRVAPGGYAWIFPRGGGVANVGIGVRGGSPKSYLDRFIEDHPGKFGSAETVRVGGAPVIISGQLDKIVGGSVLLCGESAGQVMPLTGAGIHTGIVAGRLAAEAVSESLGSIGEEAEGILQRYPMEYHRIYGGKIERSLKALKVIEKLSDGDLNTLASLIDGRDIVSLANGENLEEVAGKLMRHPGLALKIAYSLLR
ncbi:MAG: NAD(P)/FAD-dependent oxidoreductase [Candidatus Bathyarchaeia archaeon]